MHLIHIRYGDTPPKGNQAHRMGCPQSLPELSYLPPTLSSGKMRVMAVAEPVDVGARLTMPDLALLRSSFLELTESTTVW